MDELIKNLDPTTLGLFAVIAFAAYSWWKESKQSKTVIDDEVETTEQVTISPYMPPEDEDDLAALYRLKARAERQECDKMRRAVATIFNDFFTVVDPDEE